ncbi:hypothetical protein [Sphaerothrix gracilis]|uniref:hypothetical protein n=1 Tax=Sphaerothrix gracilis TaxID=3151835 RepID=UPI0031FCEC68
MPNGVPAVAPQPSPQYTATETYTDNILGPVHFTLNDLMVGGQTAPSHPPHPQNSPLVISRNEQFKICVTITFHDSPLTRLLLCLKMRLTVIFALEGFGTATETEVTVVESTEKDKLSYVVCYEGTPQGAGLTPGFYKIASVVQVGPVDNECSHEILGFGFISEVLLQVY